MGRKSTVEKNRVYVECTDAHRRVKARILEKNEVSIRVELPTGFVMELTKKHQKNSYTFHAGVLEFVCDGNPIF